MIDFQFKTLFFQFSAHKLRAPGGTPIVASLLRCCLVAMALVMAIGPLAVEVQASTRLLKLATTTSTDNSGLFQYLLPRFERANQVKVHVIAVGTGKALKLAENGDVDIVVVHAPTAELIFIKSGHGINRMQFMYNDFVVVGPETDVANVFGAATVYAALKNIALTKQKFVSRGDDSGTHKKELSLWSYTGRARTRDWYIESGAGMGRVLNMASELQAYTLTDRGTWLYLKDKLNLNLLYQNTPPLHNPYAVITVNPARHTNTNYTDANKLTDWLCNPEIQQLIANYKVKGESLFKPLFPNCALENTLSP